MVPRGPRKQQRTAMGPQVWKSRFEHKQEATSIIPQNPASFSLLLIPTTKKIPNSYFSPSKHRRGKILMRERLLLVRAKELVF